MIISSCGPDVLMYETPHVMDFAAAVRKADLLICHDSGAMHFGAAVGTKTLVLVGRGITPEIWGPFGEGHKCLKNKTVADIKPEEVIREAFLMLTVIGNA
jgi:heptosyltransferase-2/heptosyltransferase-3